MSDPVTICQTCRRTLDIVTNEDGGRYEHTTQDQPADHPPVPTSSDVQWRGRCDFCNEDESTHTVPARDFELPGLAGHSSFGAWSACGQCVALIEANRWNEVVRRAVPSTAEQDLARRLYRTLRKNITGPPQPIQNY